MPAIPPPITHKSALTFSVTNGIFTPKLKFFGDIIDFIFKESEDTQLPAIVSRLNSSGLQAPAPVKTIEEPVTEVIEENTEVIIVEPPKISKKEMFDLSV
jgi:hypothetical protein